MIFCEKRLGKDHIIYWEKAYKIERQDIFQTSDETKNHSHELTVTFRTCLTILEQHLKILNLILALNVTVMMKISFEGTFTVLLKSFVFNLNVKVNTAEG